MREKAKKVIFAMFSIMFIFFIAIIPYHTKVLYAAENDNSVLLKKVSTEYTKKFCNAIAFGLSKESAMNFSLKENNQAFKKRKEMKNINNELLAEKIAISVVKKCGYPIKLYGEEGVLEFKSYYLSKAYESSKEINE